MKEGEKRVVTILVELVSIDDDDITITINGGNEITIEQGDFSRIMNISSYLKQAEDNLNRQSLELKMLRERLK